MYTNTLYINLIKEYINLIKESMNEPDDFRNYLCMDEATCQQFLHLVTKLIKRNGTEKTFHYTTWTIIRNFSNEENL